MQHAKAPTSPSSLVAGIKQAFLNDKDVLVNKEIIASRCEAYVKERVSDQCAEHTVLACALERLDWLLRNAREGLAGRFTEQDMLVLLDMYAGSTFQANEARTLATYLVSHLGIEDWEAVPGELGELLRKLVALTPLKNFALADVIERSWHAPVVCSQEWRERVESQGLRLAD